MKKESLVLGKDCILTIRNAIFNFSLSHESFTVREIAGITGYSTTTVAKYVNSMKEQGAYIALPCEESNKKGRKATAYALKFNPNYYLGVEVGHLGLTFGLMNMNGTLVRKDSFDKMKIEMGSSFAVDISKAVQEYIGSLPDISFDNINGINIIICSVASGFSEDRITEILGVPTSIENNTNAMAYCEYKSTDSDVDNLLYVNFGWGLGLGIIIGRKLFRGSHGTAGEFGHMPLYNNNILCQCGKKGCLETEASISAIVRKVKEKIVSGQTSLLSQAVLAGKELTTDDLKEALKQEDPLCMDIVSSSAFELGKHLSGITGLFDPDSIIIAGPLTTLPDYCFMDQIRLAFQRYRPKLFKNRINIVKSTIGEECAIIGACLIARDSSTIETKKARVSSSEKTMKIPFIENLEQLNEFEIDSALVRNTAGATIDVVNWPQFYPYAPQSVVRLARSQRYLIVSFSVSGMDLRATEMEDNGRIWEDSCCEMFIASGESDEYYQIEISCIGTMRIAKGINRYNNNVVLDTKDVAKVKRWSSLERKRYELEGGHYHWNVTMEIPFSLIGLDSENLPVEIKANFCKCGERTAHPHFVSWNPIQSEVPDFYHTECFGRLLLK